APAIAGPQARKTKFRHGGRKIVAARFGKIEERGCHHGADRMTANIFSPSIAAAVPMKPGHGPHRADFEQLAEHVMCVQRAISSTVPVVPQHCRSLHHSPSRCCKKLHLAMMLGTKRAPAS